MGYINERGELVRNRPTPSNEVENSRRRPPPSNEVENSRRRPPPSPSNNSGCGTLAFMVIVIIGLIQYCQTQNNNSTVNPVMTSLKSRASCGPPYQEGKQWFAVVGSQTSLSIARKYCRDAYLRPDQRVQVASFMSKQDADKFAKKISKVSGQTFSVR